jgi:hypothetical protein
MKVGDIVQVRQQYNGQYINFMEDGHNKLSSKKIYVVIGKLYPWRFELYDPTNNLKFKLDVEKLAVIS